MKRILTACIITLIATSSVHANKVLFMNDSDEQILIDITWYNSSTRNKILIKPHHVNVANSNGCVKTIGFYRNITYKKRTMTKNATPKSSMPQQSAFLEPIGNISVGQLHFANTNGNDCPKKFTITKQFRIQTVGGRLWQPISKKAVPPTSKQIMDKLV